MGFLGRIIESLSFWQFNLIVRLILLGIVLGLVKLFDSRHKIIRVLLCIILAVFMLFPNFYIIKDGGSKLFWAPLYEVIAWNQLDGMDDQGNTIPGRHDVEFYIFPYNTHWFGD